MPRRPARRTHIHTQHRRIRRRRSNQLLIRRLTAQRDSNGKPEHSDRDNNQPHMRIGRECHEDHRHQQKHTPRDGDNNPRKPIHEPRQFYMRDRYPNLAHLRVKFGK